MAEKPTNINEVLIRAKLSLDEAIGSVAGELTPAQLKRLRAQEDVNTSCTNTGCGKAIGEQLAQPE